MLMQTAVTAVRLKVKHRSRGIEIGDGHDSKPLTDTISVHWELSVLQRTISASQSLRIPKFNMQGPTDQQSQCAFKPRDLILLPRGHQRFTKMNRPVKAVLASRKKSRRVDRQCDERGRCSEFQTDICTRHFQENLWKKSIRVTGCVLFTKGKPREFNLRSVDKIKTLSLRSDVLIGLMQNLDLLQLEILK